MSYCFAQGHITGVIFPEGMLVVMHWEINQTGLFSLPEHEFFKSFEEKGGKRYWSEGSCLLVVCFSWFWNVDCFGYSPFGGSIANGDTGCV